MGRRAPPKQPNPTRPSGETGDAPSLFELERFNQASLRQWQRQAAALRDLQRALYFDLEPERQRDALPLIDALRSGATSRTGFGAWSRIVDWQWSLTPLSMAGSVSGDGGRFNVGRGLSPETFTPFPALYIAQDFETALVEHFGPRPVKPAVQLDTLELAMRKPESFTHYRLRGSISQILDVDDLAALKPFIDVIKTFKVPARAARIARQLQLKSATWLIRSVSKLRQQLTTPNWRSLSAQFDLPSNSQIFGRLCAAAGICGILYPSARQAGKQCLALFPQNWSGSSSYLEVADPAPEGAIQLRLDGSTEVAI
jgi:RES domain